MVTEEYLDELYRAKKEEREMEEKGVTYYVEVRSRVEEILEKFSTRNWGDLVDYVEISMNGKCTGPWYWKDSTHTVLVKNFTKLSAPNQNYFETLLKKYFVIEEIAEYVIKLKLK